MNLSHLLLPLIAITSTAFSAPLLDIKTIAGKSEKEVQAVLGSPSSSEKTKQGPKLIFKEETIEVVFINGKADWITFTPKETIAFTKETLSQLGIPSTEPTVSNSQRHRTRILMPILHAFSSRVPYELVSLAQGTEQIGGADPAKLPS